MFRTLYGKLALALLIVFCVLAAVMIVSLGIMIDRNHLFMVLAVLIVAGFACALVTGVLVFRMFTRHLRVLVANIDGFRNNSFALPADLGKFDPQGDEIDRLGHAFQQMAQRINEQLHSLQRIDAQRRELLANVSHDLRTPLASMRGYLETLLLKEGTLTPQEHRNYLQVAARQAERLGKLIADLFELTKLDAREVTLNAEPFPITELVQDVVQKFSLSSVQRGVRVESEFSESMLQVHADISLIERVLENLIENALRHTGQGGVVRVAVEPADGRIKLRVSDTGSGIAPADLPNIFERFYQVDRNMGSSPGGAGLGLAIAKRVVALHGSDIKVESELGRGTSFYFDLPVAAAR